MMYGGQEWAYHHIKNYLTNEKCIGSTRFQKRYILDPISKKVMNTEGHLPQFYCDKSTMFVLNIVQATGNLWARLAAAMGVEYL